MPTQGKVVIGTVKGDLHDIGKNLVGIMLKGAGYEVIDVGCDVTAEVFVDAAEAEGASVVGLSALLTTTMTGMKEVVELVRTRGLQDKVKVIVGGAPLSARTRTMSSPGDLRGQNTTRPSSSGSRSSTNSSSRR